jgi:F-type H+-transporting ATPase subunit epsilon
MKMANTAMSLKILLPAEVFLETKVARIVAEGGDGSFCLLPRHIDFVAALVPGIFSYESTSGEEVFLAVDEGVIVKYGSEVLVSTRNAVRGPDLGQLERTVVEKFKALDERARVARSAVAKIEANFVRRFLEIQRHGG